MQRAGGSSGAAEDIIELYTLQNFDAPDKDRNNLSILAMAISKSIILISVCGDSQFVG